MNRLMAVLSDMWRGGKMTKKELKKLMDRHVILGCELENVIDFVNDLLEFKADEIERNEPYATNTIKRLRDAAYEVYDLYEYIDIEE